jgi:hypothetical protein
MGAFCVRFCGGASSSQSLADPVYQPLLCVSVTYADPNTLMSLGQLEERMSECVCLQCPTWRPQLCKDPGFCFTSGMGGSRIHDNRWTRRGYAPPVDPPAEDCVRGGRCSSALISVSLEDSQGPPTEQDVAFLCQIVIDNAASATDLSDLHVCWQDWCKTNDDFSLIRQCWTFNVLTQRLTTHAAPQPSRERILQGWRAYYLDEEEEPDDDHHPYSPLA